MCELLSREHRIILTINPLLILSMDSDIHAMLLKTGLIISALLLPVGTAFARLKTVTEPEVPTEISSGLKHANNSVGIGIQYGGLI